MHEYGRLVGLAFQIVDDVLDYAGDEASLGKPVGSDLRGGNITLPLILYVQNASGNHWIPRLLDGRRLSDDEVRDVVAQVVASGAIEASLHEARRLAEAAKQALDPVPSGPLTDILVALADYVVRRRR
ncbi:MAG: polyprenyl synthetase family protein [Ardenticatenia bacterium]|nr:polyprenyl synthetase family protein [Ardenticatenia bacterium]